MQCTVCNKQTKNPKFCSNACRQKDWRKRHPYLSKSSVKYTLDELLLALNWALKEQRSELENKNVPEILKYLYGDDRQIVFSGEEFVLI